MSDNTTVIIKKKRKQSEHSDDHKGGSWKVAYADFTTATLCFFMMMWIINSTTKDQKKNLADYFGVISQKAMSSTKENKESKEEKKEQGKEEDGKEQTKEEGESKESGKVETIGTEKKIEQVTVQPPFPLTSLSPKKKKATTTKKSPFNSIIDALKKMIKSDARLKELEENVIIDETIDGLRIQIVDKGKKSALFESGNANLTKKALMLIDKLSQILSKFPNKISIAGHADGMPNWSGQGNWELSSNRALSVRKALTMFGLKEDRVREIIGKADTEPLDPEDPFSPNNRRVSITLQKDKGPDKQVEEIVTNQDDEDANKEKKPEQSSIFPEGG